MTVCECNLSKVIEKPQTRTEKNIKNVQTEFLKQVMAGADEKTAVAEAIKVIDTKYNPEADEVQLTSYDNIAVGTSIKTVKLDPKVALEWIGVFGALVPLIEDAYDWVIERLPKKKEDQPQSHEIETKQEPTLDLEQDTMVA